MWETLHHRLLLPLKLSQTGPNGRYTLDTYTCDKKVGCNLFQEELEGPVEPVR